MRRADADNATGVLDLLNRLGISGCRTRRAAVARPRHNIRMVVERAVVPVILEAGIGTTFDAALAAS
jgi:hypothetical protein